MILFIHHRIWIMIALVVLAGNGYLLHAQEELAESSGVRDYQVEMTKDDNGWLMTINGQPTPVYGMVWAVTPIGENYNYNLWDEPKGYIKQVIDIDAKLMKEMGVNVIRSFFTIPPEWVTYLYEEHGIYTAVNYLFARYGISVNDKWFPRTDYSDEDVRAQLMKETLDTIETYKNVPGVLMFLLGNENNYGLEWKSFEIENLPTEEQHKEKARYLYSIFGEAIRAAKAQTDLPIGIVNGDILYIDLIAEYAPEMDFLATNVYRGKKTYEPDNPYSTPFFERIEEILDKPVVFSEFGSDAYNTFTKAEDQYNQADYLVAQWEDLFLHAYGKGTTQNAIGGFVFEWIDEWWKRGLEVNLDTQEMRGSWINGGYAFDFIPEQSHYTHKYLHNNMNEEWLGIMAQSEEYYGGKGFYGQIHKRIPRAAYYALTQVWEEDMFSISLEETQELFSKNRNEGIDITGAVARANDFAMRERRKSLNFGWIHFTPSLSGAMREHWGSDEEAVDFSYEQTATLLTTINPTPWFGARFKLRFQYEALDDVFEDSYSYSLLYGDHKDNNEEVRYRIPVEFYSSSFLLETEFIDIEGLFHDGFRVKGGHTDWVIEGDFFGLLPETFWLDDLDRNLSKAPFGIELTFHKFLEGLKIYGGPEIFKDARPSIMTKYYKEFFGITLGLIYEQELAIPPGEADKNADGELDNPLRYKLSTLIGYAFPQLFRILNISLDFGVLVSGMEKVGETYLSSLSDSIDSVQARLDQNRYKNFEDIAVTDALAYKSRLTLQFDTNPVLLLWSEYIYAGLVAESRGIAIRTGGFINDNGSGNKHEVKGGIQTWYGYFHIMANYLWRTPLNNRIYHDIGGATLVRDPRDDPFIVNGNRESLQAELILGYDQTGATYFHNFDNDDKENAKIALSVGYHHTFYNGPTDPLYILSADGSTYYAQSKGLSRVNNLSAFKVRFVSNNFLPRNKIIFTSVVAQSQNTVLPDIDPEWHYEGKIMYRLFQFELSPSFAWNIFGQEDWHREFGFRIPYQWSMYMGYHISKFSVLNRKQVIYVEVKGRAFEGIEDGGEYGALNTLGSNDDAYRMSVTIGYTLTF